MSTLPTILSINLVTPRGVVAHQDADSVQAPGELGEFELLPGHVPMLTALRPGVLTVGTKARMKYAVSSGYLRIDQANAVEILVEQATPVAAIDVEAARKDLATAEGELAKWGDKPTDGDHKNLIHRVEWAQARIDATSNAAH